MIHSGHMINLETFKRAVAAETDPDELNLARNILRRSQQNLREVHPLTHPKYGLALAYKLLDNRARELGLIKMSNGYCKPSNAQ